METLRKQILDKVKQVLDDNAKIILDGFMVYIRAHGEPLTEEDVQLVEGEVANTCLGSLPGAAQPSTISPKKAWRYLALRSPAPRKSSFATLSST